MTDADTAMNPQHFGSDPADRINPEIRIRIANLFRLTFWPWRSLHCLGVSYWLQRPLKPVLTTDRLQFSYISNFLQKF